MRNANTILNFIFAPTTLQQAANNAFPIALVQLIELRIGKLKKDTEEIGEKSFEFKNDNLIPRIFRRFKTSMKSGKVSFDLFEMRELRTLTYSLSHSEHNQPPIFNSIIEMDFVFQLLERRWRDSYLIGLIDCYLKNWDSKETSSFEKIGTYIFNKLKNYEGRRTILKSFKNNIKFFDSRNGDVLLGSELALKNKPIKDVTKHLAVPENWFNYPFFSKVIVAYYEKRKNNLPEFLDEIDIALTIHQTGKRTSEDDIKKTSKRVVSKIIIQSNESNFASLQDKVKGIAFKLIGDPGNAANWTAFDIATENEKEDLRKARIILNEWITRQFINVFFEKCINDTRRKKFWLKYAKEIMQFRVVGSTYIRQLLMADNRISEYVPPRFSKTNSYRDSNAALMFTMKSHLFIEFSDTGAFYAYKLSNPNAPSIESPFFESTSSLKTPSMNLLAYRTGYNIERTYDEGRLGHNDGDLIWEQVAIHWLKSIAGIDV